MERLGPVNTELVRAWAGEIVEELRVPVAPRQAGRRSQRHCRHVGVAL
jgi:hypothetical protein